MSRGGALLVDDIRIQKVKAPHASNRELRAAARKAVFVTYWDAKIPNENYQLRDLPSRTAWRHVVKD